MLLEVNNLKKHFHLKGKNKVVKAVDNISFKINEGETYGLVGESGCGKTTTARLIIKLYKATGGEILFNGVDILKLNKKEMRKYRKDIQMVFQDPYASLHPRMTIEKIVMDPLKIYNIGTKDEQKDRVLELLEEVGLDKRYAIRYPHEFSGGQRQRIAIARAVALNPKFIILDEPLSALDVSVQSQIINLLRNLQKKFNLTYLFISHDLSVIEFICDRIGVIYLGKIVEMGTKHEIFNNPMHPYTKALLSAIPTLDPEEKKERILLNGDIPSLINSPPGCNFHTRCKYALNICKEQQSEMINLSENHSVSCHMIK